ncbi:MAG: winged helix-turn-helix transcriptional regulator [Euryarchaeota archaeon]|nr:winged helix-turn-helix transcriptional regulator [Euryarchaeota archaeon]
MKKIDLKDRKIFILNKVNVQIMEKIDLKDRKILYQLDLDSRQSLTQIGKKVGLPKNVVAYRIKNLKEKGIMTEFYTIINTAKLGYTMLRFYLNYQYVTPKIEKEIIDYFFKCKYVATIHRLEGSHDLFVFMFVKNLPEFYSFWEKTLDKYGDYFVNQVFSLYSHEYIYRYSFLLDEKVNRTLLLAMGGEARVEIDDLDYQILKILSKDSRIPSSEIARKLNVTTDTIVNRIKKLIKKEVILGFRINLNFSKLGYQWYDIDIVLKDRLKLQPILNYLKDNPNLVAIDKTLGYVDLELEFILKNANQINQIMDDLATKFPDSIRNYKYHTRAATYKYYYMP